MAPARHLDPEAHIRAVLAQRKAAVPMFGNVLLHPQCHGAEIRIKQRLPFICSVCGAGRDGGWLMQAQNVFLGKGCPCCASINGVKARFAQAPHLSGYNLSAASNPSGRALAQSVRYTVRSPEGFVSRPLTQHAIVKAIREGRVPGSDDFHAQGNVHDAIGAFKAAFPGGTIVLSGRREPLRTTPGPFFDIHTGNRVMRAPKSSSAIPRAGVLALVRSEMKDRQTDKVWRELAQKCQATILGYVHEVGGQVQIRYKSRAGFEKLHTYRKAVETNWGQSRYKKGEKLVIAIIKELFPDGGWVLNTRPKFLRYAGERLELDIYSPSLRLAFEHQGYQHFNENNAFDETREEFEERVRRDKFKVKKCSEKHIKLGVIEQDVLDPKTYLDKVLAKLGELGYTSLRKISVARVNQRWRQICQNPLAELHEGLVRGLGCHALVSPELACILPNTVVTYRCGACGAMKEARAQGFTSGEPRRCCPECRPTVIQRRWVELWKKDLPADVSDRLSSLPDRQLVVICNRGHEEPVRSFSHLNSLHDGNYYRCPQCALTEQGFQSSDRQNRARVAALNYRAPDFIRRIASAGLALDGEVFMRGSDEIQEIFAPVKCPANHRFEIGMTELGGLLANKWLTDRAIVPHICDQCCYPSGVSTERKGTLFHRLAFLRGFHPNAVYKAGFDPQGKSMEKYNCGERFALTQRPHPDFFIHYRTIGATQKRSVFRMPCYVCAIKHGSKVPSSSKTLEMLAGRMLLMNEELARRGRPLFMPAITLEANQDLIEEQFVSTTRTLLRFHCGDPSHRAVVGNADNYFSDHKGGYCKACLSAVHVERASDLLYADGL